MVRLMTMAVTHLTPDGRGREHVLGPELYYRHFDTVDAGNGAVRVLDHGRGILKPVADAVGDFGRAFARELGTG